MLYDIWYYELVRHGRLKDAVLASLVLGTDSYYSPSFCNILLWTPGEEMSQLDIRNFVQDLGGDLRTVQEWALEPYFTREFLQTMTDEEVKGLFDVACKITIPEED